MRNPIWKDGEEAYRMKRDSWFLVCHFELCPETDIYIYIRNNGVGIRGLIPKFISHISRQTVGLDAIHLRIYHLTGRLMGVYIVDIIWIISYMS